MGEDELLLVRGDPAIAGGLDVIENVPTTVFTLGNDVPYSSVRLPAVTTMLTAPLTVDGTVNE
jgi:hypothetical protein